MLKYFVALFLLVVIYNQVVESKSKRSPGRPPLCQTGWMFKRGKCYRYFNHMTTWKEAIRFCSTKGGYMLKITNRRPPDFVRTIGNNFWIELKSGREHRFFCHKNNALVNICFKANVVCEKTASYHQV